VRLEVGDRLLQALVQLDLDVDGIGPEVDQPPVAACSSRGTVPPWTLMIRAASR
jgi:hypothetical protein